MASASRSLDGESLEACVCVCVLAGFRRLECGATFSVRMPAAQAIPLPCMMSPPSGGLWVREVNRQLKQVPSEMLMEAVCPPETVPQTEVIQNGILLSFLCAFCRETEARCARTDLGKFVLVVRVKSLC
jgi:hypothetical protein